MKNVLLIVLILLLGFPSITPWLPHGAIHALHEYQTKSHVFQKHDHGHDEHDTQKSEIAEHAIQLDANTYFSDHLHVDLKMPNATTIKRLALKKWNINSAVFDEMLAQICNETPEKTSYPPPDINTLAANNALLYLSTQRLRI